MKKIIVFNLIVLFLATAFMSTLMAQPIDKRGMHKAGRLQDRLNLTDEQKAKMADLRLAHQKKMLPFRSELQSKRMEIQLLKTTDAPDEKKIEKAVDEMGKIRTEMHKARIQHQLEVRKMLTPEQQKIYDSQML